MEKDLEHLPSMVMELDLPDPINEETDEERVVGVLDPVDLLKKVKVFHVEFRLLKMLSRRFTSSILRSVVSSIENICENEGIYFIGGRVFYIDLTQWNSVAATVNDMIQECKAIIKVYYGYELNREVTALGEVLGEVTALDEIYESYRELFYLKGDREVTPDEIVECVDVHHCYMNNAVVDFDKYPSFKKVKEILFLLKHLTAFTSLIRSGKEGFLDVQRWAKKAERIVLLYWLNEPEEKLRNFHLHCLSKRDVPDFIRLCFEDIRYLKLTHPDSLIFWEFVSRVVGFVMEDVVSTLKDDTPVIREGLILLITLFTFPPENYSAMDHSDLSYFQQKLNAVFETSTDLPTGKTTVVEFRFLKILLLSSSFPSWKSIVTTIEDKCKNDINELYGECKAETGHENLSQWNSVAAKVNHKILECMAKIKNFDKQLIQISLKADFFTLEETVLYLDEIHRKLNYLVERRLVEFAPIKIHIKTLEQRLFFLRNLIGFTPWSRQETYEKALHLEFHVHHWANMVVSMKLLSSLNEEPNEELRPIILWEFVSRFVDFFLKNMEITMEITLKDDDVPVLRKGLILLITFLADPPTNTMDHSVLSLFQQKIHAVFDQASHTISYFGETTVVRLQNSVDEVREEIERFYVQIAHPSWSDFPRTNGLGHFESLLVYLENLKETLNKNEKFVPFIKHQIFTIKEELMPLRLLLLQDIWKMQNNHEEVKGMCDKIICLSYQVDHAIKSSFFIDHSLWYNLTSLSIIVENIKDIQNKVMKIKDTHIYRTDAEAKIDEYQAPTSTSIVEVVVGFKHETEELIVHLTRGTKKLDIVPIVGMGGIGKTTLAKKLFNDTSITSHFHKRAFCRVSQAYRKKNVLLDILSCLCAIDDEVRQMNEDDLAHKLQKCLSRCTYLIVMDDIWDIKVWNDVRTSFPDHNMGSRVIFTTRISNISVSNSHLLPFLSVDESWELLRKKIFHNDPFPLHLCDLGKLIAEKCQGLPLAIVVIAGLLSRTERSLFHWNEVADSLTAFASNEGCNDVIRLSYQQLSEPLKSCFLYLGAFREDEKMKAKMLTKLWVAEGFVLKSGSSLCLRKVAKQYLNQLGDTNLVTVTKRSCNGGIKHFHVHDLIRDFCRTEAQQQQYLCFVNSQNSKLSMPGVCNQYRVCIEDEWRSFVDSKPRGPMVHSLLHHSKDYCVAKSLESFLCNFKLVQVLDLQMHVEVYGGFPTAVTRLIHLRYLALRIFWNGMEKIPSEISNLWNLETLLILGTKVQFPSNIWKMKKLRHVETDDEAHVDLDDDLSGILSQLPDLETFISLVIPPGKEGAELLRRLPNIRKLSCIFSGDSCFQIPELDILTNLESLQIRYTREVFFQYPYTFTFPLTIRKLTLESFELHWEEFTAVIRKLPTLQVLVLRWISSSKDAKIWDVENEEFPNLRSLKLEDSDIEEWKASTDSFPCMEKLKLSYGKSLIKIPPCFGEVPTLKHVLVRYCNKGVDDSVLQIQEAQLDWETIYINLTIKTIRLLPRKQYREILRREATNAVIENKKGYSKKLLPWTVLEALHERITALRRESALKVFELLQEQLWYQPNSGIYMKLIVMLGKCKQPEKAQSLFEMMIDEGCFVGQEAYTALLSAYSRSGNFDQAFSLLEQMKNTTSCRPDVFTYSILIKSCLQVHDFEKVQVILSDMTSQGIKPNTVTYNTLLDAFGKHKKFAEMESTLIEMLRQPNCKPDVWTMNSTLRAFGGSGQIDIMEKCYEKFQSAGIEPNIKTFNILLDSYGKTENYGKMSAVMQYMQKYHFKWTLVTYNIVIDAFGRARDLHQMEYLFRLMQSERIRPDRVTLSSLVRAYGQTGKAEKIAGVMRFIDNSDITLDTHFFNGLVDAYVMGCFAEMKDVLEIMKRNGCNPDKITYRTMIKCYSMSKMSSYAKEIKNALTKLREAP